MIVLVRGKRFLALLLGISTMASLGPGYLSHYDSGIQRTSADKSACEPGPELSVLSLNVGRGRASIAELGSYIQREAPDVLVLLETNEAMILGLQASVSGWDYTHRTSPVIHGGSVDSVILSRAPLRQETNAVSQSARVLFDLPVARIDDPRLGSLRVVAVHPMPPTHDPVMWAHTLENLRLWHETQGDMPLIMAGDFNATHAHREFRDVSQGLSDVSPRIGPLQLPSWPADASLPAFAAIDHVLVRELLEVNSERFSVDGTDHHGIFTRLARCE
ncbi:hypothetical protein CQ018_02080 [Arthrobacter sp. MYb227]|nr:hypothetical protein CQ018_02080 [Arthrobacter sp. MYb227]